jgi:PKD repeat protein
VSDGIDSASCSSNLLIPYTTIRHSWTFGDGNSSSDYSPSHGFLYYGNYTVTLDAENDAGDSASYSATVRVTGDIGETCPIDMKYYSGPTFEDSDFEALLHGANIISGGSKISFMHGGGIIRAYTPSGGTAGRKWEHFYAKAEFITCRFDPTGIASTYVAQIGMSLYDASMAPLTHDDNDDFLGIYVGYGGGKNRLWCRNHANVTYQDLNDSVGTTSSYAYCEIFVGNALGSEIYDSVTVNMFWGPLLYTKTWSNVKVNDNDYLVIGSRSGYYFAEVTSIYYQVPTEQSQSKLTDCRGFALCDFSASPISGYNPLEVTFSDSSISANTITAWNWDFGDGYNSEEQNPVHVYSNPGTYLVSLTITAGSEDFGPANETIYAYLIYSRSNFGVFLVPITSRSAKLLGDIRVSIDSGLSITKFLSEDSFEDVVDGGWPL